MENQEREEFTYYDIVHEKAQEEYLNTYGDIDYKSINNKLAKFYSLLEGLLHPRKNHIATDAIAEGTMEPKKLIWKFSFYSIIPYLFTAISLIFLGIFSSNDVGLGNTLLVSFIMILGTLLIGVPFTWLFIVGHAWFTNFMSRITFKKSTTVSQLSVVIAYWWLTATIVMIATHIISYLAVMSMGALGGLVGSILTITSSVFMFIGYHKSIGYTLRIGGIRAFVLTIMLYGFIMFISFLISFALISFIGTDLNLF